MSKCLLCVFFLLLSSCSAKIPDPEPIVVTEDLEKSFSNTSLKASLYEISSLPENIQKQAPRGSGGAVKLTCIVEDKDTYYKLFRKDFSEEVYLDTFKSDEKGVLRNKANKSLEEIYYFYAQVLEGEWFDFVLVKQHWFSKDTVDAKTRCIPRKKEVLGDQQKRIYLELASKSAEVYLLKGEGFSYKERLYVEFEGGKISLKSFIQADEKGSLTVILSPKSKEVFGGLGKIKVVSQDAQTPMEMSFYWGVKAFEDKKRYYVHQSMKRDQ